MAGGGARELVHAGSLVRLEVIARVGLVEEGTGAVEAIRAPEDERREAARAGIGLLAERRLGAVVHVLGGGEGAAGQSRPARLVQRRERRRGHGRGDERRRAANRAPTRARGEDSTPTRRDRGCLRAIEGGRARGRSRRNAPVSRRSERFASARQTRREESNPIRRLGARECAPTRAEASRAAGGETRHAGRGRRTTTCTTKTKSTGKQSAHEMVSRRRVPPCVPNRTARIAIQRCRSDSS